MVHLPSQRYPFKLSKAKRIEQLADWGLNVPRMVYVPMNTHGDFISSDLFTFFERHPAKHYNIRTYQFNPKTGDEGWNSKHFVGLSKKRVMFILNDLVRHCYCMVDAEAPEHGKYAGNLVIQTDGYCIIEYCFKPGAMVRMADTVLEGRVKSVINDLLNGPHHELLMPLNVVKDVGKPDYLFEWSITSEPSGVKKEPLIFWEWRKWVPYRSEDRSKPHWRNFR